MNPRKVLYSCLVVCFSVLLGSSWSAPAVAGDAADLRFAAGPNWGGAGTPTLVPFQDAKAKPTVKPVRVYEPWEVLWMDVWQKTNAIYRIGAADTVKQVPACTGNLGLEVIVAQTVRAVRNRKFGDAVNWMAQFQDRSLCLHYEGARGLEAALSRYTERAFKELPADQQRIAIHGTFNLGMLAYGQISYTGRSWWKGIVGLKYYPQMVAQMNAYPILELGFWSFNFQNGTMQQFTSIKPLLDMLASLANLKPAGGTKSGGGSVQEEKGNTGDGGMQGPAVGAMGAGVVSCTVTASRSSGPRGIITCQQKAMAASGIRPSFTDRLAGPFDPGVSVRDPQCAMGLGGLPPHTPPLPKYEDQQANKEPPEEPSWLQKQWDKLWAPPPPPPPPPAGQPALKEYVDKRDYSKSTEDKTGPPSKSTDLSKELEAAKAKEAADYNNWLKEKAESPQYKMQPPGYPGGGTGGACGNASNAARYMQAVANCLGIGSGSPKIPAPGGETNPHVPARQGAPGGGDAGLMDCMSQGGSLVRTGSIDPKCAMKMCPPGAAQCGCERGGGGGSQGVPQMRQPPLKAGPDCMDPNAPCGPGTGGITPGKTPPVGPGPMPGPATRGIGTVSPLQQRGTTPVSPLQQR